MSDAGTSETQNIALVRRGYEAFAKGVIEWGRAHRGQAEQATRSGSTPRPGC